MTQFKKWGVYILPILLTIFLFSCRTPAGRTAGNVVDDATISTKVKAKLFEDDQLSGFAISVDTFEGEVTLTGAVSTEAQKIRADQIARSVSGVKNVVNLLKLK